MLRLMRMWPTAMRIWMGGGVVLTLIACTLCCGGCVAAAGVVGDVATSTVSAAKEVFTAGKAEMFVAVPWEKAVEEVRHMAAKLALKTVREVGHPEQRKLVFQDDRGQEITVTVVRRSAQTTELRVDVGLFGPESEGGLVLRELVRQLPVAEEEKKKAAEE
jgi:hypothetical protein